jgi:YVTN family beta-propeller protein
MRHQALYQPQAIRLISYVTKCSAIMLAFSVFVTIPLAANAADGDNTQTGIVAGFTGTDPTSVATMTDGKSAYITNLVSNSVSVINTDPTSPQFNSQTAIIDASHGGYTGTGPIDIAISPNGKKAYVANISGGVSIIDTDPTSPTFNTQTGIVSGSTNLGFAQGVAFKPDDGSKAYVTFISSVAGQQSSTQVIDAVQDTVTKPVANFTGISPLHVAFKQDGTKAYVVDAAAPIAVIDVASDSETTTVSRINCVCADVAFVPPNGNTAYVTNSLGVWPVDVASDTALPSPVTGTGAGAHSIAFTPDGVTAYVTNLENSVSVITVASNQQTDMVHVFTGISPQGVAFTPDGTIAYVANRSINNGSNNVSVIHVGDETASSADLKKQHLPDALLLMPFERAAPDSARVR